MAFRGTFHRMLRIIWAYGAVGIILLICLCVGFWSVLETGFQVASDVLLNIFQRRNDPLIESQDGTSEELQTTPQSTNFPTDDTTSDYSTSPTFSDQTEKLNAAAEKSTDNFSNLEGLALQMAQLEQHRMVTDPSLQTSSGECSVVSPNESLSVKVPAPKSVLKSSCSETKPPTSTRSTRRIRFQEPFSEAGKSSYSRYTSPKKPIISSSLRLGPKLRRLSPAAYLKDDLNFQESPTNSIETKICISEKSPETQQTENAPMINLSSETSSNQQLADEKISLSDESNSSISAELSFETATYQQESESIDYSSEESNSTMVKVLHSETAVNQELANESEDSVSDGLNPAIHTASSTETASNDQETNKLSGILNSTNPTAFSYETSTSQQLPNESTDSLTGEFDSPIFTELSSDTETNKKGATKSMDPLDKELNSIQTTYKESEESPKDGNRYFEVEKSKSTANLDKYEGRLFEETLENISTQIKEMEVDDLSQKSPAKEEILSSNENEESLIIIYTDDICELPGKSKTAHHGENLQGMNLLSESICQQLTKESININQSKSTPSDELNPAMPKTDDEPCKSLESENYVKLESRESTDISVHKEASQEIIAQKSDEMDVENLCGESSKERDGISSEHEKTSLEDEDGDDSQVLKTVSNDVLQSEFATNQQSTKESMPSSDEAVYLKKEDENDDSLSLKTEDDDDLQPEVATDKQSDAEPISSSDEETYLKNEKCKNDANQGLKTVSNDGLQPEVTTYQIQAEESMSSSDEEASFKKDKSKNDSRQK